MEPQRLKKLLFQRYINITPTHKCRVIYLPRKLFFTLLPQYVKGSNEYAYACIEYIRGLAQGTGTMGATLIGAVYKYTNLTFFVFCEDKTEMRLFLVAGEILESCKG